MMIRAPFGVFSPKGVIMVYAVFVVFSVVHAVYVQFLLERFRKKIYLDMLEFVVERKKEKTGFVDAALETKTNKSHLKLVRSEEKETLQP